MNNEEEMLESILSSLQEVPKRLHGKRGRPALLTRAQVDEILLSSQPVDVLALQYGVSVSTILRAKNHGYITAEEDGAHSYFHRTRGRRMLDGSTLDEETRARIAADMSPAADVARTYGVSRSYVYNLRARYGTSSDIRRRGPLPREVIEEIHKSDLEDEKLAHLFNLSVAVVRAVRSMQDGEE
ncbi:hypothetical protein EVB41_045 [Rhizobium phage RHph_TM3_14A]|nr:hypothetical protein EVB29_045 [Rhizobium phage RHph_TM27A]QIG66965.1 hypothetical protein EVB30_045 [Rhizobium phage RHph_TM27B]QIG67054.1 hypothetical protein EVB31_044 [Rhizobium phage RHph_TM29]QIG67510.1 hypothetical protein EVB41_045 [Rhizobium phage RHph_TM3_14A]